MRSLLILDAGPLFSLAAGGLLHTLLDFRVGITDVVKEETIDRGLRTKPSVEAKALLGFYKKHRAAIEIFQTQVGTDLRAARAMDAGFKAPPNLGEMSIQSLLIRLKLRRGEPMPVVVFEDAWFLRNAPGLAKPHVLISTQAFLVNLQQLGKIKSASQAREDIAARRAHAYSGEKKLDAG